MTGGKNGWQYVGADTNWEYILRYEGRVDDIASLEQTNLRERFLTPAKYSPFVSSYAAVVCVI